MIRLSTVSFECRFAVLVYEFLLTGTVTSIAALAAGIATIFLSPASTHLSMLTTCLILFYARWLYSRANWRKKGQTLVVQAWEIGLADKNDTRSPLPWLCLYFIWASIFIVSIPLLAHTGSRHLLNVPPKGAFGTTLIWLILPWGSTPLHPNCQFLYDFLAGIRLVDLNQKKTNERNPKAAQSVSKIKAV